MRLSNRALRNGFIAILVLAASGMPCRADTVVLKNSDRLTGDVQKLEKDQLQLKTSYAGVITIAWNMVEQVSSDRQYVVETESGLRLEGTIRYAAGELDIATANGKEVLPARAVTILQPVTAEQKQGFWQRLEGTAEVGFSLSRGNSELDQYSLGMNAEYRADKYNVKTSVSSLFSKQTDAPTTSRHSGSVRYDRFLTPDAFAFGILSLQRDDRQLLDLRTNLGGGLGWKLIRSDRLEVSLLGGLTYVNETYQEGAPGAGGSSGEALIGLSMDRALAGPLRFTSSLNVHPNVVGEVGRYRLTFDSGVRAPLFGFFNWNFRLYDRYDSRPPETVLNNDFGIIGSLGVDF